MTVASSHLLTVLLGAKGPPFNRYTVQYYNVEPEEELQNKRQSSSVIAKCTTRFCSGCDVIEWGFLAGLTLIVSIYAIDYGLDLRRTKFQIHLALCTAATLISIIHVAVQLITVLRADRNPVLYDHAAVGMLAQTEFDDEANDFSKRCSSSAHIETTSFPIGLGVTAVVVNVLLLIAFYVCDVDLGWAVIQSVVSPASTGVARMVARGRLYREFVKRDADVSRAVLMEAAYLMREQLLLFPPEGSSTSSNYVATQLDTERYRQVCDNVRRFIAALRNSPCYSTRSTGLRLHHQHNDISNPQRDASDKTLHRDGIAVLENSQAPTANPVVGGK